MPVLVGVCLLVAAAWGYLLLGHGGFWRTGHRLPPGGDAPPSGPSDPGMAPPGHVPHDVPGWPAVVAVVPARDEAEVLPLTLPTLLAQEYPGEFSVVLVDDGSSDGTAEVAAALGRASLAARRAPGGEPGQPPVTCVGRSARGVPGGAAGRPPAASGRDLRVIVGSPPPAGWAGKVWAMGQGAAAAGECDYLLFTDADIAFAPGVLAALVRAALADDRALVSQMALLRARSAWERWIVPAFVYFFAQLYPFRRASRPGARTAAAAGGCMLVQRPALVAAGGLERIAGARIDDVALARLLKHGPERARCWLGFTTQVRSLRAYPGLSGLWGMVARSAYVQLRHSPALLAGTVIGLLWLYVLPPAVAVGGFAAWAAGAGPAAAWCGGACLAAWAVMGVTYLPVLRLYQLSPLRAFALPVIASLYAAMTIDSARRYHAGRGGEWKGRTAGLVSRS